MVPVLYTVLSIAFPAILIIKYNKNKSVKRPYMYSVSSFGFMSMALIKEILTIKRRLLSGDIGGIEDTIDAVIIICVILIIVVLILNAVSLVLSYEKD